ncbi:threonine ammonia-lyase, biosynthetic [Pandoraea nosoerga]|uniref:L-threonine dehydratase n=1 Tax=Pandoraea nosoerga TaxID=2508296 RepID=A0A5E4RAE5_9BURK|nr:MULTISPECIES: threonine ammonia-lyase, biosynthetic [Pandoraea]MBN4666696.1 threonine ammonia-lyase, biosynthetic [Pandoraea nosoerga]MBN4676846.1 threonine ammonia-lyase, biosynthetic [Pandoraea nosoerga]MBN4681548.1 threonine ammonia-lyase, biosynthetic [Pandoraea nosoerga]MBN4745965.1 threonine ammonia-lyase, biosynthetic [Pandoraea nosoerga]VVD60210.1 threonine dehydratase [Pandoraea nosoerga]
MSDAAPDYLKKILTAKVYDVAKESELELARTLSMRLHNRIYLKREDNQTVFSFKIRGAYNKMANLSDAERERGVLTASAGNHAQGVAYSAARLGCKAVIVMPVTTPQVKIDAVKTHGGRAVEVVLAGDSYSDAYAHAMTLQEERGLTFVPPFDDPEVIAGQGTIGMEILRQHQGPLHAIFVPIGGGGLAAGVAAYVKAVRPEIRIIGVQSVDSDAMAQSIHAGERVLLNDVGLFADGTAVKYVGAETFRLCEAYLDEVVRVDTDQLCAAIKDVFQDTRSVLEPSGALSVAGAKLYAERERLKGETLVAITSGANMNFDRLRFVAERAEVGEAREAVFAVTIPEARGSFRRFTEVVGSRNVTEFNYRISEASSAHIFVGIQMHNRDEGARIKAGFERHGFPTLDLSNDELSKQHIRYMVGGRSPLASNEVLFRFEFPERPGALMKFLSAMSPNWNISLFHYRNQGADYSNILVGMQVPDDEKAAFRDFLATLGYPYWDESDNPVYKLFLG